MLIGRLSSSATTVATRNGQNLDYIMFICSTYSLPALNRALASSDQAENISLWRCSDCGLACFPSRPVDTNVWLGAKS